MRGTALIILLFVLIPIYSESTVIKRSINSDRLLDSVRTRLRLSRQNQRSNQILSPIILVPGDGGSQILAKLDRSDVPHYFCYKKTKDYFNLWLNLESLVPYIIDCWVDNIKLVYDNITRTTINSDGVYTQIPGMGNTTTVEYVDPSRISVSGYFNNLVTYLVSFGYERGINIRGAPYDFRKAPNELSQYFSEVKSLITETYRINNNEKVILVCHSMGCPTMLYFLNQQTQEWKNKYIKSLLSLAGPWAGAVKSLKVFASGDNFNIAVVRPLTVRKEQRTFPSLAYLLPSQKLWESDEILIESALRNYTVYNYRQFFEDINYTIGYNMWLDVKNLTYNMTPPGVEVHCLHGYGIDTMQKLIYKKREFPDSQPHVLYGDGDGTVNLRSLRSCLEWKGKQSQNVYYQNYSKVNHLNIMNNPAVLTYLRNHAIRDP